MEKNLQQHHIKKQCVRVSGSDRRSYSQGLPMGDPGWPCQASRNFGPERRPWNWHKLSISHNWSLRCLVFAKTWWKVGAQFLTCLQKSKSWLILSIILSEAECPDRSRTYSAWHAIWVSVIPLPLRVRGKCTVARLLRHPISYLQLVTASPLCVITHAVKTRWHGLCYELDKVSRTHFMLMSGLPHLHCQLILC